MPTAGATAIKEDAEFPLRSPSPIAVTSRRRGLLAKPRRIVDYADAR
jgi:hypothetical protein